jgi:hypothetical protein
MKDRHLKSTAFEQTPSGFIYYANAWAKGIAVSAADREIYLSGAHIDWLEAIAGREASKPRRPWLKGARRMFLAAWRGHDAQSPD